MILIGLERYLAWNTVDLRLICKIINRLIFFFYNLAALVGDLVLLCRVFVIIQSYYSITKPKYIDQRSNTILEIRLRGLYDNNM